MKILALVPLFFASTGANFFGQFFDGPKVNRNDANFRVDYRSHFAEKYRALTGFERGRELFRNGFETFGYGDGKPTEIVCGDDPDGRRTWAEQSLICADMLTAEMNRVLREMAVITAAKAKNITDQYVRISQGMLEAAEISKIPVDSQGRRAFDSIAFENLSVRFYNVPEFVYNVNGTADEELFRKYSFFGIPGPRKRNASPGGLLSLIGRLSPTGDPVKYNRPSDGTKALQERVRRLNELSKPFGPIENSATYVPSMKWSFLKQWEYFDTEFFKNTKLSTHPAKLGGMTITLKQVFDNVDDDIGSFDEVMQIDELVPFIVNDFIAHIVEHLHALTITVNELKLMFSTAAKGIRSEIELDHRYRCESCHTHQSVGDLKQTFKSYKYYERCLIDFETQYGLYCEVADVDPGEILDRLRFIRSNYTVLKNPSDNTERLMSVLRKTYGWPEDRIDSLEVVETENIDGVLNALEAINYKFNSLTELLYRKKDKRFIADSINSHDNNKYIT